MPLHTTSQPEKGQLALSVERFVTNVLSQIGNLDQNPIDTYIEMLSYHPVMGMGFQLKMLLGLSMLGDYTHPDEKLQDFVRKNFEQMNGSLKFSVSEMFLACAIGYSFSEKNYVSVGREWHLDSILSVDPRRYRFQGVTGQIKEILYYSYGQSGTVPIPYEKGIHIVNMPYLAIGRDPYGVAELRRAVAAWQAWKIIVGEMIVAGQRQATPIIVAKVDTNDSFTIFNEFGQPLIDERTGQPVRVPAADRMLEQLEGLENRSVVVTDLRNEINALNQEGRSPGQFFLEVLRYLERLMLMALIIPETVVSTGITGTGDSGLNSGHMEIMLLGIGELVSQIKEGLLEGPVRDLLEWNFGTQDSYGEFQAPEADTTDRVALLNALSNAVHTGMFSNQDLDVINKGRELSGIPPTDRIIQNLLPPMAPPPTEPAPNGNGRSRESRTARQQTRAAASDDEILDDADLIEDWQQSVPAEYGGVIEAKDDSGLAAEVATLWLFSVARGQYRRPGARNRRKTLTQAELETLMDDRIQAGKERLEAISDRYYAKTITLAEWYAESLAEIRLLHSELFAVGVGGLEQMSDSDRDALQSILTFQESELADFRAKMAKTAIESPTEAQARLWLSLYAVAAWTAYKAGERSAASNRGMQYGRRHLDPTPHVSCTDCENYAGRGWVKIADLIMPGEACQCYGNCRCSVEYAETKP